MSRANLVRYRNLASNSAIVRPNARVPSTRTPDTSLAVRDRQPRIDARILMPGGFGRPSGSQPVARPGQRVASSYCYIGFGGRSVDQGLFQIGTNQLCPAIWSSAPFSVRNVDHSVVDSLAGLASTMNHIRNTGRTNQDNPVFTASSNVFTTAYDIGDLTAGLGPWTGNPFCGFTILLSSPSDNWSPGVPSTIAVRNLFTDTTSEAPTASTSLDPLSFTYKIYPTVNGQRFHIPCWAKLSGQDSPTSVDVIASTNGATTPLATAIVVTQPNSSYNPPIVSLWTKLSADAREAYATARLPRATAGVA